VLPAYTKNTLNATESVRIGVNQLTGKINDAGGAFRNVIQSSLNNVKVESAPVTNRYEPGYKGGSDDWSKFYDPNAQGSVVDTLSTLKSRLLGSGDKSSALDEWVKNNPDKSGYKESENTSFFKTITNGISNFVGTATFGLVGGGKSATPDNIDQWLQDNSGRIGYRLEEHTSDASKNLLNQSINYLTNGPSSYTLANVLTAPLRLTFDGLKIAYNQMNSSLSGVKNSLYSWFNPNKGDPTKVADDRLEVASDPNPAQSTFALNGNHFSTDNQA